MLDVIVKLIYLNIDHLLVRIVKEKEQGIKSMYFQIQQQYYAILVMELGLYGVVGDQK